MSVECQDFTKITNIDCPDCGIPDGETRVLKGFYLNVDTVKIAIYAPLKELSYNSQFVTFNSSVISARFRINIDSTSYLSTEALADTIAKCVNYLSPVDNSSDYDKDSLNEIQIISLTNDSVTLSKNGGSFKMPNFLEQVFDGDREIKRLPLKGDVLGTNTIGEWIESAFYTIEPSLSINDGITYYEVGDSLLVPITGSITDPLTMSNGVLYSLSNNIDTLGGFELAYSFGSDSSFYVNIPYIPLDTILRNLIVYSIDSIIKNVGVVNASNSIGVIDESYAQMWDVNDTLIVRIDGASIGDSLYYITGKRNANTPLAADIEVSTSSDGISWTRRDTLVFGELAGGLVEEKTFAQGGDEKYIRIVNLTVYNFDLDGIYYDRSKDYVNAYTSRNETFKAYQDWEVGSLTGTSISENKSIKAIYPILHGMSDSNFVGGNYYGNQDGKIIASQLAGSEHEVILSGGNPDPEYIYFAVPEGVSISSVIDHNNLEQIENFVEHKTLDIDILSQTNIYNSKVYFGNKEGADNLSFCSMNLDGSDFTELKIIDDPLFILGGGAGSVDFDGTHYYYSLYISYNNTSTIKKCDANFENCEILLSQPDITNLSVIGDHIYFYELFDLYRIDKSDGSNKTLIDEDHAETFFDEQIDSIYYVERTGSAGHLARTDLDGNGLQIISSNFIDRGFDARYFKKNLETGGFYLGVVWDSLFIYNNLGENKTFLFDNVNSFYFDYTDDKLYMIGSDGTFKRSNFDGSDFEDIIVYDESLYNVNSAGLENNWTLPYKLYKYKNLTGLTNKTWRITLE